jgi:hypothetical protein
VVCKKPPFMDGGSKGLQRESGRGWGACGKWVSLGGGGAVLVPLSLCHVTVADGSVPGKVGVESLSCKNLYGVELEVAWLM